MEGRYMLVRLTLATLLVTVSPALAQKKPDPKAAAEKFQLDTAALPGDDAVTATDPATSATDPATTEASSRPEKTAAASAGDTLGLDTPIATLIADRHGRAVLDKDLPGLSTDSNLARFQAKSLRQFQPLTGGQLTDDMLAQVERDLAAPPRPVATRGRRAER